MGGPPDEVYVEVGLTHFEKMLGRLGARGHDVPELATYTRGTRRAPVAWRGACTRCGAVAALRVLPKLPQKRWTPTPGDPDRVPHTRESRLDQAAPRKPGLVDVRLLVLCRGATGDEGQPWPGRPYAGW